MKVLVLGAGVAGICTAYSLARRGHSVTVVDRGAAVASEASFANGGQVSYNYVAPLAGPGVLAKLPRWLLNRDSPIRFRPRLDPDQWRWCLAFVLACNRRASRRTTEILLHLADQSRTALQHLMQDEALEFRYRPSGKLTVHSDRRSFDAAGSQAEFQRQLGQAQDILDADACVDREPAL
jgi:D-amino-acid dehydrogenase